MALAVEISTPVETTWGLDGRISDSWGKDPQLVVGEEFGKVPGDFRIKNF